MTPAGVLALLLAALAVRTLAAILSVAGVRRLSVTETGYVVAGGGAFAWVLLGADPLLASLTVLAVGLMAGGLGSTLRRVG